MSSSSPENGGSAGVEKPPLPQLVLPVPEVNLISPISAGSRGWGQMFGGVFGLHSCGYGRKDDTAIAATQSERYVASQSTQVTAPHVTGEGTGRPATHATKKTP